MTSSRRAPATSQPSAMDPDPGAGGVPGGSTDAPPDPRASGPPAPPARRRRGYWIPGLIAVAALTAIGLAFGAGDLNHRSPRALYGADVAQSIALGIQAREGTHSPPQVRCPATEPVRAGRRFVCARLESGQTVPVQVVEIDGRGHLRWSLNP